MSAGSSRRRSSAPLEKYFHEKPPAPRVFVLFGAVLGPPSLHVHGRAHVSPFCTDPAGPRSSWPVRRGERRGGGKHVSSFEELETHDGTGTVQLGPGRRGTDTLFLTQRQTCGYTLRRSLRVCRVSQAVPAPRPTLPGYQGRPACLRSQLTGRGRGCSVSKHSEFLRSDTPRVELYSHTHRPNPSLEDAAAH